MHTFQTAMDTQDEGRRTCDGMLLLATQQVGIMHSERWLSGPPESWAMKKVGNKPYCMLFTSHITHIKAKSCGKLVLYALIAAH